MSRTLRTLSSRSLAAPVVAALVAAVLAVPVPPAGAAPVTPSAVVDEGEHSPRGLRVNGLAQPADLGDLTPDYSWQVAAGMQSAYRIIVSSDAARAAVGDGDVWDSGKVSSDAQLNVPHGGTALAAGQRYVWRVQTWDATDVASGWSEAAWFGTSSGSTWAGSEPIWATAQVPGPSSAPWVDYTLTAKIRITGSALGLRFRAFDAANSFMWQFRASDNRLTPHSQVNGAYATLGASVALPAGTLVANTWTDVRIVVAGSTFTTFINNVQVDQRSDTRNPSGTVGVRTGNSETGQVDDLSVVETGTGRVLVANDFSATNPFPCGSLSAGALTVGNGLSCGIANPANVPANWAFLRTEVDVADKEIAWATLNATGTEFRNHSQYVYKTYVNGEFVGLGPTNRIGSEARYDGFDVTALLQRGAANSIAALAYTTNANRRFQAQLKVVYADGTSDVFGTGPSWTSLNGGLAFPEAGSIGTSFYSAPMENLDARQFPFGFASVGFDDSTWSPAVSRPAIPNLESTPTDKVEQQLHDPVEIVDKGNGSYFVDFGRTWVGGVQYDVADGTDGARVELRFGEITSSPSTVRWELNTTNKYRDIVTLKDGEQRLETWGMRVFRYLEIVGAPEPVTVDNLKALALVYPFDREAASFTSSDENLNQVYGLSKNTIESLNVNFYTDSWTRERINYEADGYLQQLSSLYLMEDLSLGRYSMNYFKSNRTWPTEWPIYVVLSVYDAWRQTGNTEQVAEYYDNLKAKLRPDWLEASSGLVRKTTRSDGCSSQTDCDIVDWPTSQRDGYQFRQYNTVINSIYYRAARDMAAMATVLDKPADAALYTEQADRLRAQINARLYDAATGRYDDGMDAGGVRTGHFSVHASAFALAFGVPEDDQVERVAEFVDSRGMACSVYCAAFYVKGLYDGGNGQAALDAMTDEGTSSWMNMIRLGAGSTMEAWDPSQKSNLTYSHPWAASPAFNVPAGLFGIQPTSDGYGEFQVKPQPGDLADASIAVPTVRGQISAAFEHDARGHTELSVTVPGNTTATVQVPLPSSVRPEFVPSHPQEATYVGRSTLPGGTYATFEVGPGQWTFGPRAADDQGIFQPALDGLLDLGDRVEAHLDAGDLTTDEATALDNRLDAVLALVRSASAAHTAADGVTCRADLGSALDALRDLRVSLDGLVASATTRSDLAPRLAAVEDGIVEAALTIRGITATLVPLPGPVLRGQALAGAVRLTNAGAAAVGPFTATFAVDGWDVDSDDTAPAALPAGTSRDLAFTTRVPLTQGPGPVRVSVALGFTDGGTTYPLTLEQDWTTVDSQVALVDVGAAHPVDGSLEVVEVTATVRNTADVPATGRLRARLPAGWRQAPTPERTVAAGGEIVERLRVFVPVGFVDRDTRDLQVEFAGEQVLASTTTPVVLTLDVPDAATLSDHVDFGDPASEAAHGILAAPSSGISTEAGLTRRYAHSQFPGSWFSAEVAAVPGEPIVLQVRETFNTAVTKKYDIYVDDVLVDQRVLAGAAQAKMYRLLVDDPTVLDHDGTVRVRFEYPSLGSAGFFDPSVADLWVSSGADERAPAVSVALVDREPGLDGWSLAPVTATLTATDDRDDAPLVEVDTGSGWTTYDGPVELGAEGEQTLRHRATDAAGNTSPDGATTVKVDTVAPTAEIVGGPAGTVRFGEVPAAPTCQATDATSGVATCTVSGYAATVGAHVLTATATDRAGHSTTVTRDYTVVRGRQVIALTVPGGATFGDQAVTVGAQSSAGLPVTLVASGACSLDGTALRMTGAGECTVTGSQAGNAEYEPATESRTFTVARAGQTISVTAPQGGTFGDAPFPVTATATSGLPVTLVASGACVIGPDGVTATGAGACTVTASQAGDTDHNPAPDVVRVVAIAKAVQTIWFSAPARTTYGAAPFTVRAAATSGLPVVVTASGACVVRAGRVIATGAGPCRLRATQPGDADHLAAPGVDRTVTIAKARFRSVRVTLTGTARVGRELRARVSTRPASARVTYTWVRGGRAIAGVRGATYRLRPADRGKRVWVRVTVSKAHHVTVVRASGKRVVRAR
ncbi:family 78 glycoside hydrolase catalytic domain [Nocardioides sp. C4-1]|uniref:family 78 glycoside hydrolase catalytic domain n=1 Tax=Nocardioides sp. C4-1 TaxID=3151851 RepID=UPI0032656F8A